MQEKSFKPTNSALEDVRQQFNTWRKDRTRRTVIPKEQWEAAINLFRNEGYSINKISKALRLNYSDLKRRISSHNSSITKNDQGVEFIELNYRQSVFPSECVIEMEDSSGSKMKMCFRGNTGLDLLELGKSFWKKQQ